MYPLSVCSHVIVPVRKGQLLAGRQVAPLDLLPRARLVHLEQAALRTERQQITVLRDNGLVEGDAHVCEIARRRSVHGGAGAARKSVD